jgi:hypothetical protein
MPANLTERMIGLSSEFLTETGSTRTVRQQVSDEAGGRSLSGVLGSLDLASGRATGSFNSAEGTLERQQRAIGSPMSAGESEAQKRRLGLGRALATVDARNREVGALRHRTVAARQASIGLRDAVEGQVLGGYGDAAAAETAREREYEAARAEYKQKKNAMLGTVAAIGLSFVPGGMFLAPAVQGAIANRG